jgi:hypothetical protein
MSADTADAGGAIGYVTDLSIISFGHLVCLAVARFLR